MEEPDSDHNHKWPLAKADCFACLRQQVDSLEAKKPCGNSLAWRGHARSKWQLTTTLDRRLEKIAPNESYEHWLGREQCVIARFKKEAAAYASQTETRYLSDTWNTLAFGRHAGLPTRLLDWTSSPWVAVWFACHEHSDDDGVIWWFNQSQIETVIHEKWDEWQVPTRAKVLGLEERRDLIVPLRLSERVLEITAFEPHGHAWTSKLHYSFPCPRMEAQQGFATVCGRLRKTHNDAIDELPQSDSIARGRILITAGIKREVLDVLRTMNIHAKSLEYPGVDIVARGISP